MFCLLDSITSKQKLAPPKTRHKKCSHIIQLNTHAFLSTLCLLIMMVLWEIFLSPYFCKASNEVLYFILAGKMKKYGLDTFNWIIFEWNIQYFFSPYCAFLLWKFSDQKVLAVNEFIIHHRREMIWGDYNVANIKNKVASIKWHKRYAEKCLEAQSKNKLFWMVQAFSF